MKPEARQTLTKCVKDTWTYDANPEHCALERLPALRPYSLSAVAEEHGFTRSEAYGIMDGWDHACGIRSAHSFLSSDGHRPGFSLSEYREGEALGRQLLEEVTGVVAS